MTDKKECPQYEPSSAALKGFWDGFCGRKYTNPYVEISPEWVDYDKAYDDGWARKDEDS